MKDNKTLREVDDIFKGFKRKDNMIMYTDTIGGKQVCRDNYWALTSEEVATAKQKIQEHYVSKDLLLSKLPEKYPEPLEEPSSHLDDEDKELFKNDLRTLIDQECKKARVEELNKLEEWRSSTVRYETRDGATPIDVVDQVYRYTKDRIKELEKE